MKKIIILALLIAIFSVPRTTQAQDTIMRFIHFLGEVEIPATEAGYNLKDFIYDPKTPDVKNFFIPNFKEFRYADPMVNEPYPAFRVSAFKLTRPMSDKDIRRLTNSRPLSGTEFTRAFKFIYSQQLHGEPGLLSVDSNVNVFQVEFDSSNISEVVSFAGFWNTRFNMWCLHAFPSTDWWEGVVVFAKEK